MLDKPIPIATLDYDVMFCRKTTALCLMKRAFEQINMPFFLTWGTCLGAMREHDFIPWDTDIDLGVIMPKADEYRMRELVAACREQEFMCIWNTQSEGSSFASCAVGTLHRVIIRLEMTTIRESYWKMDASVVGASVNFYEPRSDYYDMMGAKEPIRFPARLFENMQEIDFAGEKFLVPTPAEEYLKLAYGKDWRTPKQHGWEEDYKIQ